MIQQHQNLTLGNLVEQIKNTTPDNIASLLQNQILNSVIPGIDKLVGCSQGEIIHLEGDVAKHTAYVIQNLTLLSQKLFNRPPSNVEYLAALIHDIEKPATRAEDQNGNVTFPEHEEKAANRVFEIAANFRLSENEKQELDYLVRNHGIVHSWPMLAESQKRELATSSYFPSLTLLQHADALSCWLNSDGSQTLSVHYTAMKQFHEFINDDNC